MPALRLTAGAKTTPARKSPARTKPAATTTSRTPKRKPAASKAPARKAAAKTKPVAAEPVVRGPRMPEGWKQRDWDNMLKTFSEARDNKQAAAEALTESQTIVNELAMDAMENGVQMSVVSEELSLSRQRLYDLMELYGVQTERQAANPHPNKGLTQEQIEARAAKDARKPAKTKPAAKRTATPAIPRTPKRKPAAAKRSPARKSPARKPAAATNGRGRVTLARR